MKVAVLGEAASDEAVVRTYVDAVLGRQTEPVGMPYRLRANGGWKGVQDILPVTIRSLHFGTEAAGLVVVLDSDDEPPHEPAHEATSHPRCRLCKLRTLVAETTAKLKAGGRIVPPLQFALGLAVPCLEAWLLHGSDPKVNERAWANGLNTGRTPFTRPALKVRVYGTDRPGEEVQTRRGTEEAARSSRDLDGLIQAHPGFGALAADLRRWPTA